MEKYCCIRTCDCGRKANHGHCGARTRPPTAVGVVCLATARGIPAQSEARSKRNHRPQVSLPTAGVMCCSRYAIGVKEVLTMAIKRSPLPLTRLAASLVAV